MLTATDLPDDPEVLRALLVAARAEAAQLAERTAQLTAEVERKTIVTTEAEAEIARLNAIIAAFMRHRFGPRSEKLGDDQFELVLEDMGIALGRVKAKLDAASTPKERAERERRTNRGSLPAYAGAYSTLTEYLRLSRPDVPRQFERRFETLPGEQAQADFAEFQVAAASIVVR